MVFVVGQVAPPEMLGRVVLAGGPDITATITRNQILGEIDGCLSSAYKVRSSGTTNSLAGWRSRSGVMYDSRRVLA